MPDRLVLLVPTSISTRGVNRLERELEPRGVTILGKDANLILARLDENSRQAIGEGLSIQEFFVHRVPPRAIRELPDPASRIATLWNWSIDKRGRRVTDAQVHRVMEKLQLEVRDDQVYDRLTRTNLGRVESEESEDRQGNWCMRWNYGWERIFGWFGYWEKLWAKTRTYAASNCTGSRRLADYIVAEVDGPQHYAARYRYNASIAYTYDWDYIWFGQSHCGTSFHYARIGRSSISRTRTIC